jgi:hypothetical protein
MLSYGNMTRADTTTEAESVSDATELRVKSKSKTHKKKSAVNSKARKNEQTAPLLKEGEGLSKNSKESVSTVKAKSKAIKSDTVELKEMVVTSGRAKNLLGLTGSASQGEVSQAQFEYRPLARNGELVELIPGTIATQHSGSGKANQYFLRGYNLDHGTDFTTIVDGIPMNMPTNAHGQGYMDLNSLMPELVDKIEYGKGPYYAEIGDFSAAGYAKMSSMKTLAQGFVKYTGGEFGYNRAMGANSTKIGDGNLLYSGEFQFYNGVWAVPENSHKYNGMLRYTLDKENWGMAVNAKAYNNAWTSTNQIPQSAIDSGALGLYGSMNPSDGGNTNRYSLSTNLWNKGDDWKNDLNLYAVYYNLNLYSDFTGYLNGPQGDQVNQTEARTQIGGNLEHTRYNKLFGFDMDNSFGFNFRHDQIDGLGLNETVNRQYLNTISLNNVDETTAGAFLKNLTHWNEKFRTIAALRGDVISNQVTELANGYSYGNAAVVGAGATATATSAYSPSMTANSIEIANPILAAQINAANSGSSSKAMLSPKFSAIFGPWYDTEYFVNVGEGYHSNDARGTRLQLNPGNSAIGGTSTAGDGSQLSRVTPMAWARGGEIGTRTSFIRGLNSTLALWWLQSQQELVFSGDDGTTSVNGMSDRYGLELTNYYKVNDWVTLDFDLAKTSGHFVNTPQTNAQGCPTAVGTCTGTYIPNLVGMVIASGVQVVAPNGMYGSLRLRHFGDSPLDSNGTYWASSVNILNLGLGYKQKHYKLDFAIFNLLGQETSDIAYAYTTQYPATGTPNMALSGIR